MLNLKAYIRDIPDFPEKGVIFKDITPLLKEPEMFKAAVDRMCSFLKDKRVDLLASAEARGFIFASAMAYKLGVGFIPIRKPGKLPYKTISMQYTLEYGTNEVEIHEDAVKPGQRVVIVDDVLATGGTVKALASLIKKLDGTVTDMVFLIELEFLKARELLKGYNIFSVMKY